MLITLLTQHSNVVMSSMMFFYLVEDICVAMKWFVAWIPAILRCAT